MLFNARGVIYPQRLMHCCTLVAPAHSLPATLIYTISAFALDYI